ncbi:long-chain fatty acid-CoA ligase [Irineochytrium annulatum]|nr:long-chain fatty acid-CoA ligase [Irineochytrium annulatum]
MFTTLLLWSVSLLLPFLYLRTQLGPRRVIEHRKAQEGEGAILRHALASKELFTRPDPSINSIYDILLRGVRLMPKKNIMGARTLVRMVEEEKEVTKMVGGKEVKQMKKWTFFQLSPYSWITYADVFEITKKVGSGLRKLGLNPKDKVTIFASTSRDWMCFALSCVSQNITITTAYDTLGEEGLSFSLNECEVTTLFTNADLLPMMGKISPIVKTLKNVIYNGDVNPPPLAGLKEKFPNLKFIHLDDLMKLGAENPKEPVPPTAGDLACIMYTSGSTGNPKGVMLEHAQIIAAVAGGKNILEFLGSDEYYLAYLPLAHILEFAIEIMCLYLGISLGYGTVRTLTDSSCKNCLGDIRELRPTMMGGVPAVWEGIRKAAMNKLREASAVQRQVFQIAFDLKWALIQLGLPTGILDTLVFNKIKALTGGRLKFALSGGAPMPKTTQKFMSVCIAPFIQGYGMTESVASLAIQSVDQYQKLGIVGGPLPCGEVKLVDVADTAYSTKNKPRPQGEVWLRGNTVMKGYYKQPDLTKETITEDGWLMTGDIGEWQEDGNLVIIDRKKNLVKLSNGEYIALEKLESQYKLSPFVQNICVFGDSEQSFCIAIVQPIVAELVHYMKSKNIPVDSQELADLAAHPETEKAVLASLKEVAKTVGFKPAEIVGGVIVVGEEWTPQNGMLTAAMKLKRKEIVAAYKDRIYKLYR